MTEPQTNPESFATLRLRFETKSGPRTILMSNLSVRDAALIAAKHRESGQYAEYEACGAIVSMPEYLSSQRRLKVVRQSCL